MGAHPHRQTAASRSRGRLTATLALTCAFLVVEVAGALGRASLALRADAGHRLADAGGLGLALFAIWIAGRPPTPAKTYGYYRAEILAALVNAVVLLVVAAGILLETYRRLVAPPAILGGPPPRRRPPRAPRKFPVPRPAPRDRKGPRLNSSPAQNPI